MRKAPKVRYDSQMNVVDVPQIKSKSKPRNIEYELFLNMVVERDRVFYKEGKYREFLKARHDKGR